jgi:thioredoxin reductase (NADPH)
MLAAGFWSTWMSDAPLKTDIAIIGAGPVGLFAVFEAGMLDMRCVVLDALDMTGGQCAALYPEKPIYDIPGHPKIDAQELVEKLVEQAAPFQPEYRLGSAVTTLKGSAAEGFLLETAGGTKVEAKAVVIAAGCGAFGPNRPPIPGLEAYEGKSVHYLVRRREDFRGQRIVIAGGGDSAVDWALSLPEVAAKVMVVHRRPKFRAAPESEKRLRQLADEGKVELVIPYQLDSLEGQDSQLTAVIVKTLDGEKRRLEADHLLAFFGLSMDLGPIASWGLNHDKQHIAVDPATLQTSTAGIFAVGDIAHYPGKLKLILSGFSEAAMAMHAARNIVHPGQVHHFEYSTTRGVPGA